MRSADYLQGFESLGDKACCAVIAGVSSPGVDEELAYKLGEILGQAFRALYDLGQNLIGKLKKSCVPA
ncbi:MAG: hypothetical protein LC132_06845 [Burkholderiales bacterium]|nr:hypothetical protein [Burkholderiales bacterium]